MKTPKNENGQPRLFDTSPEPQKIRADFPGFSEHGAVRHSDPETSKIAAAHVKANALELIFLYCLYKHGPRTAEEVTDITGRAIDTITPRTAPLKRKGLIVDSGERLAGKSGSDRIVWALTDLGREVVIRYLRELD